MSLGLVQFNEAPFFDARDLPAAAANCRETAFVVRDPKSGAIGVGFGGQFTNDANAWPCIAILPPIYPEWLGDRSFVETYKCRFPYMQGAMAKGIASVELVKAVSSVGGVGCFGAGGLSLETVESAVASIRESLGNTPFSCNLMHSPGAPDFELALADLYLRHQVPLIEAAAFLNLTPALVYLCAKNLSLNAQGQVVRRQRVMPKISRPELARRFFEPAPREILDSLVANGRLTATEAAIAQQIPLVEDLTAEANSGGHTDCQAFPALLPIILELRDKLAPNVRIGAAGGMSTPRAVASAFAMGAAYVVTGSANQSAVESGLESSGRALLCQAELSDVMTAPAADMFEQGAEVQVLKRGTLFGQRARKLNAIYRQYQSLSELPDSMRKTLETQYFRCSLDDAWQSTENYWRNREPAEAERAARDPHYQMALLFRSYLGQSSVWAIQGTPDRSLDRQIWCGPAMGAFNDWVRGSFLEAPEARHAGQIALNLLEGAAQITRAQQLRASGAAMPNDAFHFSPRPLR